MPERTDLEARMGALIDGAAYDWTTGPDVMRWQPAGQQATALMPLRINYDPQRAAALLAQLQLQPVPMGQRIADAFAKVGAFIQRFVEGLGRACRAAGQALMKAFGLRTLALRSVRRTMRRAAGPVTRADRDARRARRRQLARYTREARRG